MAQRSAAAGLALTLALALVAPAHARWDDPINYDRGQITANAVTSSPLAAWTDHGRFAFDSGQPVRAALPLSFSVKNGSLGDWPVNALGDVLLVAGTAAYGIRALAQDASGLSAATSLDPGPGRKIYASAWSLASDGTALLAWSLQPFPVPETLAETGLSVRIRPPGGQFGETLTIPTAAGVEDLTGLAGPNGTGEIAFSAGGRVYHADVPGGSPVAVAKANELYDLVLAPGRVVVHSEMGLNAAVRGPSGWTQQPLGLAVSDDPNLVVLGDGTSVLEYARGGRIMVARAAPGAPFGAPIRVARTPAGTNVYETVLAAGPAGELLLAWLEESSAAIFARVQTAFAPPGQAFGRPEVIPSFPYQAQSPLAAAISPAGRRLVTWWENPDLKASLGDAQPAPTPRADKRPPRVRIDVSAAALRAAQRSGRLPVKVTCNEACDVYLGKVTHGDVAAYLGARGHVFTRRAGSVRTVLRFPPTERRQLRLVLSGGQAVYHYDAQDIAGNVRSSAAPLPLLVG